jgi:hypothetical protein
MTVLCAIEALQNVEFGRKLRIFFSYVISMYAAVDAAFAITDTIRAFLEKLYLAIMSAFIK